MSDLSGKIVITREAVQTRHWLGLLHDAGLPATGLPLLRFRQLKPEPDVSPVDHDWVLLASPRAVVAYMEAGFSQVCTPVVAMGPGTAAAMTKVGLKTALDLDSTDGVSFSRAFAAQVSPPAKLLLAGPKQRRVELAEGLVNAGFTISLLNLYETIAVDPAELPAQPCDLDDVVFFCSPSAVKAFTNAWNVRPACVAIGATTGAETRAAGFSTRIAAAPDLNSMIRAAGLDHELTVNLEHEA